VLYWTTNNLFSLVRNVAARTREARPPGALARQFASLREQR